MLVQLAQVLSLFGNTYLIFKKNVFTLYLKSVHISKLFWKIAKAAAARFQKQRDKRP